MAKNSLNQRIFTLNCNGRMLLVDKPLVMGIMNITPDSFYSGSRFTDIAAIIKQFENMILAGADIIDIGGQSTRPGSERIDVEDELSRVIPVIESLTREFPAAFISVDTFYSKVALESVAAGACIINDISCGRYDANMLPVVASLRVPYVCMHAQGTPDTMQQKPEYENVTKEVLDFLIEKTGACHVAGINDVIIDPGFGFGKTIHHNFELLKNLSLFQILHNPILLGISRKSTIYKTLKTSAGDALNGTTVLNTIGLLNGANILRVHDVREAREVVVLLEEYFS